MDKVNAAKELLRRRAAKQNIIPFTQYTHRKYIVDPFHTAIGNALDDVIAGKLKRLMVFAPPRHGKSHLCSISLPSFWIGKYPDTHVIMCSYAAKLIEEQSRKTRDVVTSDQFRLLFPDVTPRKDSRAVDNWRIAKHGGGLHVSGIGGGVTGFGGDLIVIDDPVQDWAAGQSALIRDTCYDWYKGTLYNRQDSDQCAIVLIMTRWNEDDLAGRLLNEDTEDKWTVLRMPALAETQVERDDVSRRLGRPGGTLDPLGRNPGEPLAPSLFNRDFLLDIREISGPTVWSSLYQGSPRALEGTRIKRAWFGSLVDSIEEEIDSYSRYWDKASTVTNRSDWTVGVLMGRGKHSDNYYILDVVRGRWEPYERDMMIRATCARDEVKYGRAPATIEQEPGSSGVDSANATIALCSGYDVRADKVTGKMEVRIEPFIAQAEAGNIKICRGSWNYVFVDECVGFPNASHDDQLVAVAGAFLKISRGRHRKYVWEVKTRIARNFEGRGLDPGIR